jgi:peptide/nickel transport system substrate-binding protein
LLVAAISCGCVRAPNNVSESSSNKPAAETKLDSFSQTFPNPGPFKLREVVQPDHSVAELWEARGDLGAPGGTLTVSTIGSGPKTFNYWVAGDVDSSGIGFLLWERLLDIDAWTGKPYPRLAKSVEISPNKVDYIIKLRKGLKWSDGKPTTADDVIYTIEVIVGQQLGQHGSTLHDVLSVYGKFPTVEKLDDLTVKFHTAVPFAPFLQELASVPIAPKHAVEPIVTKSKDAFSSLWSVNCDPATMVTSGRFKIERYLPGQRVEFVRNPNYSFVDKQGRRLPYLDKFVFAIVPDLNALILKFYAKELDLLDIRSIRGQDAALMKQREQSDNFKIYNLGPDDGTMFLMVNMCRRKNPKTGQFYVDPVKQSWFNNLYFRQALSHAIDRTRMVANILRGVGTELYTPESTASVYFNKKLKPYPQDLDLSTQLLKRGGFVMRGEKLCDSAGNPVEFTLHTNAGNTVREAVCVMIANDLKKLGIKVNFQPIDFNILVSKVENSLDWDAVVMGLTGSKLEVYDGANVWKSDGRLHMFDQRLPNDNGKVVVTDARDWEKRIDQLFDLGATTFDEPKRHAYYDEYQQIVYEQVPYIYLYSSLDLTACRNNIGNYRPMPLGVTYTPLGSMHNLEEIFVRSAH